jgi:hypothetical protein
VKAQASSSSTCMNLRQSILWFGTLILIDSRIVARAIKFMSRIERIKHRMPNAGRSFCSSRADERSLPMPDAGARARAR